MKGQFSIETDLTIIVFIIFISYFFFQLVKTTPSYIKEVDYRRLQSEAYQISELLINDPGEPANWDTFQVDQINQIKRIGLLDEMQNKANLISQDKLSKLNDICNKWQVDKVRELLGTEYQLSIYAVKLDTAELLVDCHPQDTITKKAAINITRNIAISPNSYGQLILELW